MNWEKDWWRYLAVVVVVGGLIWWRNRAVGEPVAQPLTQEQVTEQKTNQFLQDAGISIPAGTDRANLADVNNVGATGVATRKVTNGTTEVSVIAGIADESKMYVAWLKNDSNQYKRLGTLRVAKGGLTLDYSGKNLDGYGKVIVSEEVKVGSAPTKLILEGGF